MIKTTKDSSLSIEALRQLLVAVYASNEESRSIPIAKAIENVTRWIEVDEKAEEKP